MTWPVEHLNPRLADAASRATFSAEIEDELRRGAFGVAPNPHPKLYPENEELRRRIIDNPDDDAPRREYAAWVREQDNRHAAEISEFVETQLRIADALRVNPKADVSALRPYPPIYYRLYDIQLLLDAGLVGWPEYYRGFVEHVAVRAERLLEISDELFGLAPIRHLTLTGVPSVVDKLAAWPQLARIKSLQFPVLGPEDELTDDVIARLLSSPYLQEVAYLRIARVRLEDGTLTAAQSRLTPRAYEQIVTAPSLPRLSYLRVDTGVVTSWAEPLDLDQPPGMLSYFDRVRDLPPRRSWEPPASGDLRETPKPVVLHPEDWVVELERKLGYVPCVHPEEHYRRYNADLEAVVEHPIALDPAIMARRGEPVPDPGPKPSLMQRRKEGLCAICGSKEFDYEPGATDEDPNPYSNPYLAAVSGILICRRCGTRWYEGQWETPPRGG